MRRADKMQSVTQCNDIVLFSAHLMIYSKHFKFVLLLLSDKNSLTNGLKITTLYLYKLRDTYIVKKIEID